VTAGGGAAAAADDVAWPPAAELDPGAAPALVEERLHARIADVLGVAPSRLNRAAALTTLGLDSLLAVRIRNAVQHDFDILLPPSLMLRGASIDDVLAWLLDALGLPGPGDADAPALAAVPRVNVLPRDAAERMIAAVWEEVLGRSGVGVTNDFGELGGETLTAHRASELLSERCGRRISVQELFAQPTIEQQAELLREPEPAAATPLRLLRAGDAGRALCLFHPGGGDTLVYRQLVERLDAGFAVWGLDRLPGALSVEQRAEHYVELLRAAQPGGPYVLAGWSFGGALAYETALRLDAVSEEVELVALIDTILPLPDPPGLSDAQVLEQRFRRFGTYLEQSYGKPLALPCERMARLDDEAQTDLMIETIVGAGLLDEERNAAIIRHQRTSYLDVRALERYQPAPLARPVVYLSARDEQPGTPRDPRFDRRDEARGWDAVCGDALQIVTVPGHHLSLLDPPHVESLAAQLNWLLSEPRRVAA